MGRMRRRRVLPLALILVGLLAGCGKHYWQASGRGVTEFRTDSGQCIKEAMIKYDVASEKLYRGCMRARGWERVKAINPTALQFRGPEDDEDFARPPDPLSERGPVGANPACTGPSASRPPDCPPRR